MSLKSPLFIFRERMKASLKLRENQDPVLKSKIPLKILGFPFRSSLEASSSFSTAFESGPSFKLNYRPNDPCRPFGLVLKTGIGSFGSPVGAPISISAEFNLLRNKSPSFFLHLTPRIGDFANKQTIASDSINFPSQRPPASAHDSDSKIEAILANKDEKQEKTWLSAMFSGGFAAVKSLVSSGEMCARTVVPVRDMAVLNLRWGLRSPATSSVTVEEKQDDWPRKMQPCLVLNKIGIEHVEKRRNEAGRERDSRETEGECDVEEACLGEKKELEVLRNGNALLKRYLDKFKTEMEGWQLHNQKKQTE